MRGGPLLVWRTDGSPAIGLTGKGASDIGDDFYACALNAGRGEGGPAIERVGRARFERGRGTYNGADYGIYSLARGLGPHQARIVRRAQGNPHILSPRAARNGSFEIPLVERLVDYRR